jgi:hypothetical protein
MAGAAAPEYIIWYTAAWLLAAFASGPTPAHMRKGERPAVRSSTLREWKAKLLMRSKSTGDATGTCPAEPAWLPRRSRAC